MAWLALEYADSVLQNQTRVQVIVPDQIDGPLQSLYLLHGLGDDGSAWQRKTNLEALVADKQVAVIMPAVGRSWYQDVPKGVPYWTFLTESLPRYMNQLLPLSPCTVDHFVAGNSMGGYGALKWASAQPQQFGAVGALSPVTDFSVLPKIQPDWAAAFPDGRPAPVSYTASVPLFLAIGQQDFLYPQFQEFVTHRVTSKPKIFTAAGAHDWQFWQLALSQLIDWLPLTSTHTEKGILA